MQIIKWQSVAVRTARVLKLKPEINRYLLQQTSLDASRRSLLMFLGLEIESVNCCFTSQPADSRAGLMDKSPFPCPVLFCVVLFMILYTLKHFTDGNCYRLFPINNLQAVKYILKSLSVVVLCFFFYYNESLDL